MNTLVEVLAIIINAIVFLIIIQFVIGLLFAFNVINSSNQFVNAIGTFLYNVTEPVLRPIRRVMPDLGGIDISPIIVLLLIFFLRSLLWTSIYPMVA